MTSHRRTGLICALAVLISGCATTDYTWGWYVVWPTTANGWTNVKWLLGGIWMTIALSLVAIMFSIVLGLAVALPGLSEHRGLRAVNRVYVEVFRAIPMLVMILWIHYGLPVVVGLNFSPFMSGVVALALCDSAFEAEIFRGGIQSIEKGQIEASHALGLGRYHTMRYVILPQAIRRIMPPLGNQFDYMVKMSSLVSIIGLSELIKRANELTTEELRPLEIYTFLVFEYLILVLIISYLVRRMERRLTVG